MDILKICVTLGICFLPLIFVFVLVKIFTKVKFLSCLIPVVLGVACVLPVAFCEYYIRNSVLGEGGKIMSGDYIILVFLKVLVFIGLVEEGLKFGFEFLIPRKNLSALQFMGLSMIFGIAAGCFESVVYYLDCFRIVTENNSILQEQVVFSRMFTSDVIHCCCSGLSALTVYAIKYRKFYYSPLVTSIVIHGLYDLFMLMGRDAWYFKIFAVIVILLAMLEVRIKYLHLKEFISLEHE